MKRIAAALLVLVGCGGADAPATTPDPVPDPKPEAVTPGCVDRLCVEPEVRAGFDDVAAAHAACERSESTDPAPAGSIRISAIAATVAGGLAEVRIAVANTSGLAAMEYPGLRLEVVDGAATVTTADGSNQLYGIGACEEHTFEVTVAWDGAAPVAIKAIAADQLGQRVSDEVAFRLE